MRSLGLVALSLAGVAALGAAQAASSPKAAIEQAAAAPFRDEIVRDAHALCSDLTPAAGATIAPAIAPPGASCETATKDAFAATTPTTTFAATTVYVHTAATQLTVKGTRATGVFPLIFESVTGSTAKLEPAGRYRLQLEQIAGRWLVSSQARLIPIPDCQLNPPGRCHPGVQRLLFVLGESVPQQLEEAIVIPKAVKHAGGRVLREFEAGARVTAQSGCLACHKIGSLGNRGPGPNLTHVGERLDMHQIEDALISPREPMPSFNHLPRNKLHALVRFLTLLR